MEDQDEHLLTRASQGDFHSFEALLRRYEIPILSYAFRMSGDTAQSERIFDEVFRALAEALDSLPLPHKFDVWIFRTARRFLLRGIRETRMIRPQDVSPSTSLVSKTGSGSVQIRIRDGLESLQRSRREALILKVYHNLSYKDISTVLGAPVKTVNYWIELALSELRGRL